MNQLSMMHTYIVETESNFYGDGGVMKSGGGSNSPRFMAQTGTYLKGSKSLSEGIFDEIQFWSGNVSALKNRPENFIKGECFFEMS